MEPAYDGDRASGGDQTGGERPALVDMRGIAKHFGGVAALTDVSVDLFPGEVVGLLGHNGAGKSTLIKILSGAYAADSGEIRMSGNAIAIRSPREARAHGSRRSIRRWRSPTISTPPPTSSWAASW
jgi:ABC-type branched-subunit amino acid transport system ATPase component